MEFCAGTWELSSTVRDPMSEAGRKGWSSHLLVVPTSSSPTQAVVT